MFEKIKKYFQRKFGEKAKKKVFAKENFVKNRSKNLKSAILARDVQFDLYLPPSYFVTTNKQYPLLFFNDGQDMKAVNITDTLNNLYSKNQIREIIVIAIYPADRMQEYGTIDQADYANRGNKASDYNSFITTELLPYLQKSYRCHPNSSLNTFAGFSLGGLSAIDLVWNNEKLFGKVGVFSGALWWRSAAFDPNNPDANRIVHTRIAKGPKKEGMKFWFQTGTNDEKEDRNNNGIIDSIDDTTDLIKILKNIGYTDDAINYVEVIDGEHNPKTWGAIMPEFLVWAFGK